MKVWLADKVAAVPHSFGEVVEAFESHRQIFEAGGVFPARQIECVLEGLRDTLREVPNSS